MKKILLPALIFTLSFPMLSCAASFDCTKATTLIEKLICRDSSISILDNQLAENYKQALAIASDKEAFKKEQIAWLKSREKSCGDENCLRNFYQERVDALRKIIAPGEPIVHPAIRHKLPLTFRLTEGEGYPVCKEYIEMLNASKYMEYPSCDRKILPEFKQFKGVDWKEIMDKDEIKRVTEKSLRVMAATHNYPGNEKQTERDLELDLQYYKKIIENGELKLFFIKIDLHGDGKLVTVYRSSKASDPESVREYKLCAQQRILFFDDGDVSVENAKTYSSPKGYWHYSYSSGVTDYNIFNRAGAYYYSGWTGLVGDPNIVVSPVSGSATCKIAIQ